jgi:hypothetical protein
MELRVDSWEAARSNSAESGAQWQITAGNNKDKVDKK